MGYPCAAVEKYAERELKVCEAWAAPQKQARKRRRAQGDLTAEEELYEPLITQRADA